MRISDWSSDVCSSDLDEGLEVAETGDALVRRRLVLVAACQRQRQQHNTQHRKARDTSHHFPLHPARTHTPRRVLYARKLSGLASEKAIGIDIHGEIGRAHV